MSALTLRVSIRINLYHFRTVSWCPSTCSHAKGQDWESLSDFEDFVDDIELRAEARAFKDGSGGLAGLDLQDDALSVEVAIRIQGASCVKPGRWRSSSW